MATMLKPSQLASVCAALCLLHAGGGQAAGQGGQAPALEDYTLEQLADIVVTSVSRQQERLSSAPASVYVISSADIARSGASTVPEALRLAPNLQVAFTGAQEYAISTRGFSSPLANKLLVLVDGRSVYSPLFSGVYWEALDVVLADVERIEVISGPGGTIWGTNAVNGVINIITRSAADTQGSLAQVHAGNRYAGAVLRHGKHLANGAFVRVYGKRDEAGAARGDGPDGEGGGAGRRQAGFRLDWAGADQSLSVSGDLHAGALRASREPRTDFSGANLVARFDARLGDAAALRLQAWVDQQQREQPGAGRYKLDTVDLEAQMATRIGERHALTWGGGLRQARDRFDNGPILQFAPSRRRLGANCRMGPLSKRSRAWRSPPPQVSACRSPIRVAIWASRSTVSSLYRPAPGCSRCCWSTQACRRSAAASPRRASKRATRLAPEKSVRGSRDARSAPACRSPLTLRLWSAPAQSRRKPAWRRPAPPPSPSGPSPRAAPASSRLPYTRTKAPLARCLP